MTQFVYKDKYIQYRGYIFANGNPVVIKDEATDRLLRSHPDFKIFEPAFGENPLLKNEDLVWDSSMLQVRNEKEIPVKKEEPVIEAKKRGRPFKGY
jgi:hypothetical protein